MSRSVKPVGSTMTVYDHIHELQMRLLVSVISLIVAGIVVYLFYEPILVMISSPLGAPLYYSTPAGSFNFLMKICFSGALIITIPILTYNIIMFTRPAFKNPIPMRRIFKTTAASTMLAIAGAAFAFYIILPGALRFFGNFQVGGLSALISADDYLNFVTSMVVLFVIIFQIPLVVYFIDKIKPIDPKKLFKFEKWVIIISLIIALLSPFALDIMTGLLVAVPIIVLYNLSIMIVLFRRAKARHLEKIAVYSTIAKPTSSLLDDNILLYESAFDDLTNHLPNIEEPKTVNNLAHNYSTVMDVKKVNSKPEDVKPAEWVLERKLRREAINSSVKVFSDFKSVGNINRALTSQ